MSRVLFYLLLLFSLTVLIACGGNNAATENSDGDDAVIAEEDKDTANEVNEDAELDVILSFWDELPAEFPSDFPFPDSIDHTNISSVDAGDSLNYTFAFGHGEDEAELENTLIS